MGTTYPSPNALTEATVGASSVAIATANLQRLGLYVFNPSATLTLWVSPLGTAAAVNGSGSVAIQPLQGQMFGPPNTPAWTNGMNAVYSGAGPTPVTVLEYYT